jgi:hypothetical protein
MTFEEWWKTWWGCDWKDGQPISECGRGCVEQSKLQAKEAWEAAWGEAYMKGFKDGQTVVKQQPNYRKVNVGW